MRVKNGRSPGAILRKTSRADSMLSVVRASVMTRILPLRLPRKAAATAHSLRLVSVAAAHVRDDHEDHCFAHCRRQVHRTRGADRSLAGRALARAVTRAIFADASRAAAQSGPRHS